MDCTDHLEHRVASAYNVLHSPPIRNARSTYKLPKRYIKRVLHDPPIMQEGRGRRTALCTYKERESQRVEGFM